MRKPSSKENIVFCLTSTSLLDILLLFFMRPNRMKKRQMTLGVRSVFLHKPYKNGTLSQGNFFLFNKISMGCISECQKMPKDRR